MDPGPAGMNPAIEAKGLGKDFGSIRAVDEVDLRIPKGEIYCLVGPNGAGKTTLLNLLSTQILPTRGTVRVLGYNAIGEEAQIRRSLSVVPQEARPDGYLRVCEHVVYYLVARGMSFSEARQAGLETAKRLDLGDRWKAMVGSLSGGMRRRVLLCMAIASRSPFLLLDEPTAGLDILVRRTTWRALRDSAESATMILTTHSMEEAEALADRIGILDQGRLVGEGTPGELRALAPAARKVVVAENAFPLALLEGLGTVHQRAGKAIVFPRTQAALRELLELAVQEGIETGISNATLEDVFIHLVDKSASQGEGPCCP